jgi:hypothetical protein
VLYVSTPSTITAHYVVPPAAEAARLTRATALFTQSGATDGLPELSSLPSAAVYEVQSVQVATTQVSRGRALSDGGAQAGLPPLCPRPGALWRLLRVTDDAVWMCSSAGHAWAASLRHPGLRALPVRVWRRRRRRGAPAARCAAHAVAAAPLPACLAPGAACLALWPRGRLFVSRDMELSAHVGPRTLGMAAHA